jgi:hypothetical protein
MYLRGSGRFLFSYFFSSSFPLLLSSFEFECSFFFSSSSPFFFFAPCSVYVIAALFLSKSLSSPSFLFLVYVFHLQTFGVLLELDGKLFFYYKLQLEFILMGNGKVHYSYKI